MLAVAAGVFAPLHEPSLTASTGAPATFGVVLIGLIVVRLCERVQRSRFKSQEELRQFCRQLSRMVYLLLYVIIALRLIIGSVGAWNSAGAWIDLALVRPPYESAHGDPGQTLSGTDTSQAILAWGIAALAVIRFSASGIIWRMVQDTEAANTQAADHLAAQRRAETGLPARVPLGNPRPSIPPASGYPLVARQYGVDAIERPRGDGTLQ